MSEFFRLLIFLCLIRTVCQCFLPPGPLQTGVDAFLRLTTLLTLLRSAPSLKEVLPW
ncbi:MAG: hypothetical protein IKT57_02690 [Clostridia bacterium]|nr:hypothetical protein [Clostridia bacterium]